MYHYILVISLLKIHDAIIILGHLIINSYLNKVYYDFNRSIDFRAYYFNECIGFNEHIRVLRSSLQMRLLRKFVLGLGNWLLVFPSCANFLHLFFGGVAGV